MRADDTICLRIAQGLRIAIYSAFSLIVFSMVLRYLNLKQSIYVAASGIGLVIIAPVTGMVIAAVYYVMIRNYKYFLGTVIFLILFAFVVAVGI